MSPNGKLAVNLISHYGGKVIGVRNNRHVVINFINKFGIRCMLATASTPSCPFACRKMERTIVKLSRLRFNHAY